MSIYHEFTGEIVESPDLSAGYLYDGTVVTGQRMVKMEGESGLRVLVDVTNPCKIYHPYTGGEELGKGQAEIPEDVEQRLSAVEEGLSDAKEGLSAAKILLGVE